MKRTQGFAGIAATTILLGTSTAVFAGPQGPGAVYDYAQVVSAEPIVRYVTVREPVRECWDETEYYTTRHAAPGVAAGTLAGAVIGGVVGHQFGSGSGKDAATFAGSLLGAAIGNQSARRHVGYSHTTVRHERPVRRCENPSYPAMFNSHVADHRMCGLIVILLCFSCLALPLRGLARLTRASVARSRLSR